ncbi:unnamed protein product [Rotaria sp. Silwood1]|nr:unnamed protein product [Rotaria sp. Silwood1]
MYSKAGEIVQEVFSSLRTVLSLNGEKLEEKRYESKLKAASWSSIRKGAVSGLVTGWIHLIVITLGRNIINVGYVSPLFQSLEEARGASTPIFRLIDEEEKISMNEPQILQDSIACEGPINMNGDIQFDNINFAYPTRSDALVLRNLTLMARAGETIALVGSNGSGKSTCISLLLRFYEPLSGRITINNRSITDFNLKQFRQKIGVVSQEPILFATSIYENIRFGKQNATKTEIEEAARLANAHDFIMQLSNKYDTIVGESGVQLSGGQRMTLIGASGRGKTTVIQLLERFYDPIQGRIYLDGVNIRNLNIQWLRSCLGLVNQEPVLFNMTIAENIAYGRENTSIEDIINAAIKANIHHFIQQLPEGYKTKVGMKGCQLSCGEKQRIALARTFIRQPKILLLDEATSAMDSYNEQIIQDALEKADTDDPTRTTLIISHRLSTIRPCDMICILDKGYIVEGGTHEDLMKRRGVYYEMIVRDCTS